MLNLYEILGLTHAATQREIKEAYRNLAKKYHPDISKMANAEEKFIVITEAYEILRDPEIRRRYDLTSASPSPNSATSRDGARYEKSTSRARDRAKREARKASKRPYKKRADEYFDNYPAFLVPKMLGCFGFVSIAVILMLIVAITLVYFEVSLAYIFFLWVVLIPIIAMKQINFNEWHNSRQKKRMKNK